MTFLLSNEFINFLICPISYIHSLFHFQRSSHRYERVYARWSESSFDFSRVNLVFLEMEFTSGERILTLPLECVSVEMRRNGESNTRRRAAVACAPQH